MKTLMPFHVLILGPGDKFVDHLTIPATSPDESVFVLDEGDVVRVKRVEQLNEPRIDVKVIRTRGSETSGGTIELTLDEARRLAVGMLLASSRQALEAVRG